MLHWLCDWFWPTFCSNFRKLFVRVDWLEKMTLMDNFPLMNIKKWNDLKYVLNTQFLNLLDPIANDKFPVISTLNTLRHSSKIVSKLFLNYAPSIKPFSWFSWNLLLKTNRTISKSWKSDQCNLFKTNSILFNNLSESKMSRSFFGVILCLILCFLSYAWNGRSPVAI